MSSKGGKREGTGPKPKVPGHPNTVALFTRVPAETAVDLDRLKGSRKTADVVREAVQQWIEREKAKK